MKPLRNRAACLLLCLTVLFSLTAPALAAQDEAGAAMADVAQFFLETVTEPTVSTYGGDWVVFGLARSGCEVPNTYYQAYYAAVEDYVAGRGGVLHTTKYTEYSRVILALTAIGKDPADVAGYNLLTPLGDFEKITALGVNGPIYALLALDSGGYEMPVNPQAETQATRQMYVDEILSRQREDGGWLLTAAATAPSSDPDITAMALQALAKYTGQPAVAEAVERGLTRLSTLQNDDGGYSSYGVANAESAAQVVVALCELGISLDDERFVKNGQNPLDNLLTHYRPGAGFVHEIGGATGLDIKACEQGFYALVAACRAAGGRSSLFRVTDAIDVGEGETVQAGAGLPGKHADVRPLAVTAPGVTFADIAGHANQAAIEALAARGVINGMGDGVSATSDTFVPDETMTRAQFATIVVRALGLAPAYEGTFTDVPAEKWYAPYVDAAASYGLINGRGNGIFDPETTITRQEAAVLVTRAAALCGMDTELDSAAVRDMLAQFGDYVKSDAYTRPGLAFCYSEGILDVSDLDIRPLDPILRCEIAQMIYNLLGCANLI